MSNTDAIVAELQAIVRIHAATLERHADLAEGLRDALHELSVQLSTLSARFEERERTVLRIMTAASLIMGGLAATGVEVAQALFGH